jgi:rSAM/selenodomain-associated transferase 2
VTTDIDVVIPTLNALPSLARTLAALSDADCPFSLSVTVCDGGSRDDTASIARDAGAFVVTSEANRGQQLAAGAEAGKAPWLLFLHADTVLGPGCRDAVAHFLSDRTNDRKAGYFRLRLASPDPRARRVERLAAWRCRRFGLPYGDQGLLMARTFYHRLGGFRPLPLMEDVEFVRRLTRSGRLRHLTLRLRTSARRWEREGWVRRSVRNLTTLGLYAIGVSPERLARRYYEQ